MAGIFGHQAEEIALKALVNHTAGQTLVLRLFTNDVTPTDDTVAGDLTEASGYGYSPITLTGGSWTYTAGDPGAVAYAQQTFTFTGALGNVYGYYYTQTTSGVLVGAERFSDGPYNIQQNGDTIKITPTITAE